MNLLAISLIFRWLGYFQISIVALLAELKLLTDRAASSLPTLG